MNFHSSERIESQNPLPLSLPQQPQEGTTFLKTCFHGLNALPGVGIFSIPYALSEGGWLSLVILFSVAALCLHTVLLLQRCMDTDPLIRTYPDIGQLAFGRKGKLTISTFIRSYPDIAREQEYKKNSYSLMKWRRRAPSTEHILVHKGHQAWTSTLKNLEDAQFIFEVK